MMMKIPKITQTKKVVMGSILTGVMLVSQNVVADDCRLSVVLDRTGSMGDGATPTSRCAVGLDFAIGVVQGFINGDDVRIISAGSSNPINPEINAGFYDNKCLLNDRKVEIITVSDAASGSPSSPDNFTGGFVDPVVALSQLQTLQLTDGAGTSSCSGQTAIADALCVSASNLRSEAPDFSDYRKMEIITDGGENASNLAPSTVCDANLPTDWIPATGTELFSTGGVAIVFDSTLLSDLFFSSSSAVAGDAVNNDEVSGSGKLSVDEQNFFASLSLNTGGSVDLITSVDDVAGTFTSSKGGGIDLCDSDFDKDFDVDSLDALRFTKDFKNPACQIK